MRNANTQKLIRAGILSALIIVMTVVPYTGYIYYGLIEITTLHIVVAIGAVLLGWRYGAVLGFVWGATCMVRALTNPLWAPFINPLISLVPRIAVGLVAGLVADLLRKLKCRTYVVAAVSAAMATLTNTVLVLTALKLFSALLDGAPLTSAIYSTLIGVNGIIEMVAAIVITPGIITALRPRELTLGIDMGASTTKLALIRAGKCIRTLRIPDGQSLEAALDDFDISGVRRVAITGVGVSEIGNQLRGLPTTRVDEFLALSNGASRLSKRRNFLAVSVGTGTSFTRVTPLRSWHIGGTGIGGAMLKELSGRLCDCENMQQFQELAEKGDLSRVDLQLRDVCPTTLSHLQPDSTVANFGKSVANAEQADVAAGLCNLVFQNIGIMAAFAVKKHLTRTIVLVGTITDWPIAERSFSGVSRLHKVKFVTPQSAPFATAVGAALTIEA